MFYSEAILSRRGPLAKVWLAAHMERKLSKTQTLQTDIEQAAGAIMGQEVEVMALRLSGQLLLGVVRIYSRKAKYLLDDCNEALLKIKMAFRPGIVDMSEDQLVVNRNAITLQGGNMDLDIMLPDINWDFDFEERLAEPQGAHVARRADITLPSADDFQLDLDDPGYGFDLGPSDGIGSQDFGEIDLGLDWGDGPVSVVNDAASIEVGRDAATPFSARESVRSHLLGEVGLERVGGDDADFFSVKSRQASENPFIDDMDLDAGFGPEIAGVDFELGIDFGDGPPPPPSEHAKTPEQTRSPSRMSSPLTEPPATPPPDVELTPRAAARAAAQAEADAKARRKPKEKKQIIDSVIELQDGPGPGGRGRRGVGLGAPTTQDVSEIVTEQHFLPRSAMMMRLLEIRDDPIAHFLPTKTTPNGTFFYAGPPGLAPELNDLFLRPVGNNLASRKRGASPDKSQRKKPKTGGEVDEEEENDLPGQARRAGSAAPSHILGSEMLGGPEGLDFPDSGAPMDDFQMDVGEFPPAHDDLGAMGPSAGPGRARSKSAAPSTLTRMSTPAVGEEEGEETYADLTCPIASFDERPSQQSQSQAQTQPEEAGGKEGSGYSRNTVKAISIIRRELAPEAADESFGDGEMETRATTDESGERVMSFATMSEKASRRAASAFFFEMLVLGTRDCIKLSQPAAFENIEVRAKDRLWDRQRHASAAPSIISGLGS
ncbi:hypothetical protein CONPUDRAFT_136365 [Coniophora puteana RWD-64-598 SS2]|uniref:Rad21/Rec8-like protein N-terminal domain-containing protein n=1 Tax=Coniophora puteana (strain RWD-64-598) TaxID=741705 RepID=A0A5M3MWZ0_CONPW|nr:uncharacterized protein CONPUDRAFT_136365 [Coniophora puteana RWD-64-598 SS2]EIW83274.1 hypothetical protein CONPUDRAFT_136365 [Coniophora puteana RWD-64-598 SS2]